ncbi:MAG: host specificity protein, partial [Sulfitobacter sp.]|nr:host specificity protein [Sulfitobacter sp.]
EQSDVQLLEGVRIEPQVYDLADIHDEVVQARPFVAPVPVLSHFMDLPLLRGDEVPHAPYVAATAQPWPGPVAVFQSSTDANYGLTKVIGARSTMGVTRTSLPAARAGVIDRGDVLEVELISGSLSSVSEEALLSGANMAAIGDGSFDKWEVFQFAEAELVAPRTYWLKTRLRGQAGSDGLMPGSWPSGSSFVLLDGTPSQLDLSPNLRRVAQHFRIGPARRGYDDPSYRHKVLAFDGNGLRPYVPCHLRSQRNSIGDYTLSWIRRTRIDGDAWETPEVPLGEESESYVLRVMQNGAVMREELVPNSSWHYTAAMQSDDGITAPFDVAVAQVSATYGTGPFRTVRIVE